MGYAYNPKAKLAANYEIQIAGPFDVRTVVNTKDDLLNGATFSFRWFKGMVVAVVNDEVAENNGLYLLKDVATVNWVKLNEEGQASGGGFKIAVLDTRPEVGKEGTFYLIKNTDASDENLYDEYLYENGAWERIGGISLDLSNYYTKEEVGGLIENFITLDVLNLALSGYVKAEDLESSVSAIIEQKIAAGGLNGNDGGYYYPSVVDNKDGTMTISFTSSKSDMPTINPITVDLPESEDGGYYTPSVEDNSDGTMTVSFTASNSGMPEISPVTVTIPAAKDGDDGGYYTPSVKDNGNGTMTVTFTASKSEMATVNPVTISLPVPDSGGYYTPSVSTTSDNEFKISFTASKSDMPPVSDVTITLPAAKDGVGIESIVQTTTSTDDGGDNVITITLTDGNELTFTVKNGSKGSTGRGISKVEKTNTSDLTDTYTITYSDGTTYSYTVVNGAKGDNGIGIKSVLQTTTSEDDSGDNIITVTLTDNTQTTFKVKNGSKGSAGRGISRVEKTSVSDLTDTYTITYTDGTTSTFTVVNGKDGDDGVGIKTIVQTTTSSEDGGENVITITLTNGNKSTFKVNNGSQGSTGKTAFQYAKDAGYTGSEAEFSSKLANNEIYFGDDEVMPDDCNLQIFSDGTEESAEYTLTEADKASIVQAVLEALGGQPVAGYFDEDNNIVLTSTLPDGTYTFRIETSDGVYELGTLTKKTTVNKYTVTFMADGQTVKEVEYEEGATSLDPNDVPAVPAKDGYTGVWESYDLSNGGNITVNAVYTAIETEPDEPTAHTNFANPSDQYWQRGYRLATGYGYGKVCEGHLLTNFVPAMKDDEIYVTGLNLFGYVNSHHAFVGAFSGNSISEADTSNYTKRYTVVAIAGSSSSEGAKNSVTATINDDGTTTYSYTILMKDGTDNTPNYENRALDTTAYVRISAPTIDGVADSDIVINVKRNGVWL